MMEKVALGIALLNLAYVTIRPPKYPAPVWGGIFVALGLIALGQGIISLIFQVK